MEQVDAYYHFLHKFFASWQGLPDKPEETPDTTLRALWYLANGEPRSVERSIFDALPSLSDEKLEQLDNYVEIRLTGTPLSPYHRAADVHGGRDASRASCADPAQGDRDPR